MTIVGIVSLEPMLDFSNLFISHCTTKECFSRGKKSEGKYGYELIQLNKNVGGGFWYFCLFVFFEVVVLGFFVWLFGLVWFLVFFTGGLFQFTENITILFFNIYFYCKHHYSST